MRRARLLVFTTGVALVGVYGMTFVAPGTVSDTLSGEGVPAFAEPSEGTFATRCGALPAPVAEKAAAILEAAQARDYDALLALAAPDDFTYSFGDGGGDPTVFWRALDMGGDDVRAAIAGVLQMPCAVADWGGPLNYVWPAAFEVPFDDLSEAELAGLAALYPDTELSYYFIDDMGTRGYVGWRLIIDEDGRWTYFIAGD